jgi:hypothetical protein|tara:strand:- start:1640 stop:2818 length:1179 start_codon:yes stop_codon:yes gene_type:complete
MHLVEQYSLAMGARINKPFIETNYYPLSFKKYIVVENGADIKSRIYGMWSDVILGIKPHLDEHDISIVQIGHKDSESIPAAFDLRGRTTTTQQAFLLKNSMLHCSTNDFLLDIASSFDVPVVGMYGNTFAEVAKPYWGDKSKHIMLESHRNGDKPSFLAEENPRTINFINPEDIAYSILKLLNIEAKEKQETKFIGDQYTTHVLEAVPDFSPPQSFNPGIIINLRMDYKFDLQNMVNWGANRKVNIFTNKVIDLNYLNAIKNNIVGIQQEVCTDLNTKYLSILNNLQIRCELFTKNERALGKLRMKYFDYKVSLKKEKSKENVKGKLPESSNDLFYKSNKLLFSNGKKYLSKYDYSVDRDYNGTDLQVVDDPKFWQDQDYIRIYKKSIDTEA